MNRINTCYTFTFRTIKCISDLNIREFCEMDLHIVGLVFSLDRGNKHIDNAQPHPILLIPSPNKKTPNTKLTFM